MINKAHNLGVIVDNILLAAPAAYVGFRHGARLPPKVIPDLAATIAYPAARLLVPYFIAKYVSHSEIQKKSKEILKNTSEEQLTQSNDLIEDLNKPLYLGGKDFDDLTDEDKKRTFDSVLVQISKITKETDLNKQLLQNAKKVSSRVASAYLIGFAIGLYIST